MTMEAAYQLEPGDEPMIGARGVVDRQGHTRRRRGFRNFSLRELDLVDSEPEASFDNLTWIITQILNVPVGLVSLVDRDLDRQFFKSQQGLAEPWASARQTRLTHSFCQQVEATGQILRVNDATRDPRVFANLAIPDLGVIAYLGVPIHDVNGKAIGAVCAIQGSPRDWTDEDVANLERIAVCVDELIELKAFMRTVSELNADQKTIRHAISHELKSPVCALRSLLNEIKLVAGDGQVDDLNKLIDLGQQTLDRMNTRFDGTTSFFDLKDQSWERGRVSLRNVVMDALYRLKFSIYRQQVLLQVKELPSVVGHHQPLTTLFRCLVANAIRYRSPDRRPEVAIGAKRSGRFVEVTVRDNGQGIHPNVGEKVFDAFSTGHALSSGSTTGLGLAMCRHVVREHGGEIDFVSKPGEGTEFSVKLLGYSP